MIVVQYNFWNNWKASLKLEQRRIYVKLAKYCYTVEAMKNFYSIPDRIIKNSLVNLVD